jgi:hypothetical protein
MTALERNKMKNLDLEMENNGLSASHWQQRYEWENDLERIYQFEEIQWQRRGGVKWILEGDSNSRYFHGKANGREKSAPSLPWKMEIELLKNPKK